MYYHLKNLNCSEIEENKIEETISEESSWNRAQWLLKTCVYVCVCMYVQEAKGKIHYFTVGYGERSMENTGFP